MPFVIYALAVVNNKEIYIEHMWFRMIFISTQFYYFFIYLI